MLSTDSAQTRRTARGSDPRRDEACVRSARAGVPGSFEALFLRHYDRVERQLTAIVGPSPDLDDLIQSTFISVYLNLHRFRAEAKFSTWLYRITANVALGHIRKTGRRRRWEEQASQKAPESHDSSQSAEDLVEGQQRLALLYALLDKLSAKKRLVFVLHVFEGRSIEEIAQIVKAPPYTVRTRLRVARLELRKAMARRLKEPRPGPWRCDEGRRGQRIRAHQRAPHLLPATPFACQPT